MGAQPGFRYPSPESRLDFALWADSRWHGKRPRYWRFDAEQQVLFIDTRYWSGQIDSPVLRQNIAESLHALLCSRLGWRRAVAGIIRRARSDLRRQASVDLNAHNDRREEANFRMRAALMRLRIIEDKAVKILPPAVATELAEAIQGVVNLIRKQHEEQK